MDFIASTGETELEEDTAKMVPNHNFNPGQARKRAWEQPPDLMDVCKQHEELINQILEEEEVITQKHKEHIDSEVDIIKEEMKLLADV